MSYALLGRVAPESAYTASAWLVLAALVALVVGLGLELAGIRPVGDCLVVGGACVSIVAIVWRGCSDVPGPPISAVP